MFGCSGVCSHAYMWWEKLLLLCIVTHSMCIVLYGVRCCDVCLSVCSHLHMWFSRVSRLYFSAILVSKGLNGVSKCLLYLVGFSLYSEYALVLSKCLLKG